MSTRVLVFGAASMVGSDFVASAPSDWTIIAAGRHDPRLLGLNVGEFHPLDLTDREAVNGLLDRNSDDVWVNFAARTDVDGCEAERRDPAAKNPPLESAGSAWLTNGEFPGWAAARASSSGRFLVHVSTDYVFDGTRGPYSEEDEPSGFTPRISWYGYTKGVGETNAVGYGSRVGILRIAHPYRSAFPPKLDFARTILQKYATGDLPKYYSDQTITPTWIPDVSAAIRELIRRRQGGLLHIASPDPTTPFEFARAVLEARGLDTSRLVPGAFADGAKLPGRAPRPQYGGIDVHMAHKIGVHPLTFREGLQTLAAAIARPPS